MDSDLNETPFHKTFSKHTILCQNGPYFLFGRKYSLFPSSPSHTVLHILNLVSVLDICPFLDVLNLFLFWKACDHTDLIGLNRKCITVGLENLKMIQHYEISIEINRELLC